MDLLINLRLIYQSEDVGKGYGLGNMRLRSTFSLQYGHVCFLPTIHQPRIQNS